MVDWVLPNAGLLTFIELTNASRDVCIIYMLPVRVLEQKHHVRCSFQLLKKTTTNIRRRRQMRRPSYKPSYKTASVGLCFQRKSSKALKDNLRKSLWPLYIHFTFLRHGNRLITRLGVKYTREMASWRRFAPQPSGPLRHMSISADFSPTVSRLWPNHSKVKL